ncbi:MAG TPA: M1 family aminopeptidase [Candidatus Acidoferrales bacterium]|nr:M1 family aminopeptidase [Candidatus Acidoferrales bacterium]
MRAILRAGLGVCLAVAVAQASRIAGSAERKLYDELNALRVDRARLYHVRQFALRRDAVRLVFEDGTLGLLEPFHGRVLGAVFSGSARLLATPRDPAEKRSISRFLGAPLLDSPVSKVYLRFTDGTGEEIEAFLRSASAKPIEDTAFLSDWNPVVGTLNPASSLRTLRDLESSSPLPFFQLALVSSQHGVFEVSVDDRRAEQVLLGQVKYREGGRYYDLWAMFPRSEGPAQPGIAAPVRYTIETTIEENLGLRSRARIVLRALRDGERVLPLILSRELHVQSVTDASGHQLDFFQNEDLSEQEILSSGNDLFFVVLPEPTRAGQEIQWDLEYSGSVITAAGNKVFYVGERGAWYPRASDSPDFCSFDLTFRWPRKLNLVATGKKAEEHEEGEWRVGHWTSDAPLAIAGFNLGSYTRASVDAGPVHVTVNANQQLEEALHGLFRQRPGMISPSVPLGWRRTAEAWRTAATLASSTPEPPPLPPAVIGQLATDIGDALSSMEHWNGTFPFARLEVSPLPAALSQSWPGLIYLSTMTFVPKEAQQRAGVTQRASFSFSDLMPFHELAHQWWGNLAGFSSYRDDWIMEGLANYIALLYLDAHRPAGRVLGQTLEDYRGDLLAKLPDGPETVDQIGPLALGQRLDSSRTPDGYRRVVYAKATWVVHMLRMMLQESGAKDPDARFRRLLHSLLEKHRFGGLSEADLRHELARIMTPEMDLEAMHSMDWFFDQWVHATGIPHYAVEYKATPGAKGYAIQGVLRQQGVPETFLARVPLYRAKGPGKPVLLGWVVTSGEETPFRFSSPVKPDHIVIDAGQTLLAVTE